MKIDNALVSKSIAFGGRYSSDTFNENHRALFGDNFVVSGFSLVSLTETVEGSQLEIILGPGVFCSKGVFVKVSGETVITSAFTPTSAKLIVGHTSDNKPDTPVSITFINPPDLTEEMAVLGYYTPPFKFTEGVDTKAYLNKKQPFYRPASHVSIEELASDVASGLRAESHAASTIINNTVSLNGGATGYRLEVKNISMASGVPHLLVFYMGTLLEEDTHYFVESPGTIVIRGGTTLGFIDTDATTIEGSYAKAFIDILYSEDFLFKQKSVFVYNSIISEYYIDLNPKYRAMLQKGTYEPIIFVNRTSTSGGTLLNADRYTVTSRSTSQGVRDSILLSPRLGWEATNDGYVTDDYNGVLISTLTIVGVRGISSNSNIARALDEPGRIPVSGHEYEALLPIVDGNNQHPSIPYKFMEVGTPYKVESGELQVFVDGKLSPCEHFMINKMSSTASSTPLLDGIGYQRYASDKNSSAIEIGTIPIKDAREFGTAHAEAVFRNVNVINFRPSYLLPRTREFTYGSRSFGNLNEAADKPGISEALFNSAGNRYFNTASVFEFADAAGIAFNGNYFVTYESLAGIVGNSSSASQSVLSTLTMSVSMFFDVPLGVGLSLQESNKLNYFSGSASGWYADGTNPTDADGGALTDSSSGLYTVAVDADKYFSANNPIVTYAALDAYLQPWMDCFGFTDGAAAPRAYNRNAGVTYNPSGSISTSFSDQLANYSNVGGKGKSLIDVVDAIADGLSGAKIPIGTAHGYAYGGSMINLTTGTTYASINQSSIVDKYPLTSEFEFEQGIYLGNTKFESPFKKNAASSYSSAVIKNFYASNPSDCWYGIFSTNRAGGSDVIGDRVLTDNNITVILSPIPSGVSGFNHANELAICRYRFCHLGAGGLELNGAALDAYVTRNEKPDIGFEIFALTRGGGSGARHALVEWSVFGPLDKAEQVHNHTADLPNQSEDEHWFRIDDEAVSAEFGE